MLPACGRHSCACESMRSESEHLSGAADHWTAPGYALASRKSKSRFPSRANEQPSRPISDVGLWSSLQPAGLANARTSDSRRGLGVFGALLQISLKEIVQERPDNRDGSQLTDFVP